MATRERPRRQRTRRRRARRRGGSGTASDLLARILVALPAIVFAIVIVDAGGWVFTVGVLALGIVCLHELMRMFEPLRPVKLAGFLAIAGLAAAAEAGGERQVLLAAVAFVPVMFLLGAMMPPREGVTATSGMAITLFGVFWIGMAIAHAVLLRDAPHGNGIVIDILVGTFVGDTGAYLGGRLLGRRPLAPTISPNKTIEGLAVGVVAGVAGAWFAGLYQDWLSGTDALLLGAAAALTGPIGDLFESALKRGAGTKDTGRLFGPHGGALDRLDAVLFAAVAGYWVWRALL
jgi:phosphatidate cytidylyltransferase